MCHAQSASTEEISEAPRPNLSWISDNGKDQFPSKDGDARMAIDASTYSYGGRSLRFNWLHVWTHWVNVSFCACTAVCVPCSHACSLVEAPQLWSLFRLRSLLGMVCSIYAFSIVRPASAIPHKVNMISDQRILILLETGSS